MIIAAGSACVAALILGWSDPAAAQDNAARNTGIEEIIVTAQKREQNVQDVPIAVTALTPESLQANRVQNVMDLNGLAPGLLARQNAGGLASPSYSMRGVFASASQPSSDRQISSYIDGVYIGATRGSVFDLPDIQRIEVLRGPQGTLFGRNATAGAINIVTRDPTGKFGVRQEITLGNYAQFRSRTSVDLPQMGPFSAYVSYVHDERHGDVRNLGAGTPFDRTSPFTNIGLTRSPKWLGSRNFETLFAAVRFEPSSDVRFTYKFDLSNGTNTPEARAVTALNPTDFTGSVLLGILAAQPAGGGAFGPVALVPDAKRPKATNNAWTQEGFTKTSGHNLTTDWDVSDSVSVKNITAYRRSKVYGPSTILGLSGLEYTAAAKAFFTAPRAFLGGASYAQAFRVNGDLPVGSYFAGYEGNSYGKGWQVSSETQVNYDSDLLTLTVGGLWYHSNELSSGLPGMSPNFSFKPVLTLLDLGNVQEARAKATSIAAYAQGEFHVTPKLDIVLGGRITKDKKSGSLNFGGTFTGTRTNGTITGAVLSPWSFKKTKPTYSIGVNYKPTTDIMAYGKYSTAFLSGGAVGQFTFAPETVKSWEAGLKSEWFDRRLRVNLALYDAQYDHSQASVGGIAVGHPELGVVVIDNGTLKAKGVELETVIAPVQGLTFGGSLGYTDAKLTDPNLLVAQGRPYKLTGMPKWIGSLNAQYATQPILDEASLFFRIDGNYQGKFRAIPFDDLATVAPVFKPYEFNPGRWIVNGRIALRDIKVAGATGEIAIWGRNLFDNKDPSYPFLFGSIGNTVSFQTARTYGVDFIVNF